MKSIKVIIAVLLILTINLGTIFCVEANGGSGTETKSELLSYLSIMPNFADGSVHITRAEFAGYLASACQLDKSSMSAVKKFNDITSSTKYAGEISALVDLGIISGDENGMFCPDDDITPDQAVKMLVSTLGKDVIGIAEYYGGYPLGYSIVASSMKILKNVNFESELYLTGDEAAKLIYNLIFTDIYDKFSDSSAPFMQMYLKLAQTDGIVTDDGITSLDGDSAIRNGYVKINGIIMENPNGFKGYLGKSVTAFYTFEEDEYVLIYIYEKSHNETVIIQSRDIENYANFSYTYYKDGLNSDKTRTANLETNYKLIYNKCAVTDNVLYKEACDKNIHGTILWPESGYVELIDNDGDNKFEVVLVNEGRNIIVDCYNEESNIIYDKLQRINGGQTFVEIEKYDDIYVSDSEGLDLAIENITATNTVLTLFETLDGSVLNIVASTEALKDVIVEAYDDSLGLLTAETRDFYCSKEVKKLIYNYEIIIGARISLYVNGYGEIVYIEVPLNDQMKIGYIMNSLYDDLKGIARFKLCTETGVEIFNLAEKVVIDGAGQRVSKLGNGITQVYGDNEAKRVVLYKLNDKNEISHIDTIESNTDGERENSLYLIPHSSNKGFDPYYLNTSLSVYEFSETVDNVKYSRNQFISSDLKAFIASSEGFTQNYDYNDVIFTTDKNMLRSVGNGTSNKVYFYRYSPDGVAVADIVLVYPTTFNNNIYSWGIITKILNKIDDKGNLVTAITTKASGKTSEHFALALADILSFSSETGKYSEDGNDRTISVGDIVRIGASADGYLRPGGIHVLYDCDEDEINVVGVTLRGFTAGPSFGRIWPYRRDGEHVEFTQVSPQNPGAESTIVSKKLATGIYFMEFDKEVKDISIEQVDLWRDNPTQKNRVIWFNNGDGRSTGNIVVYK